MAAGRTVTVNAQELRHAFEFFSAGDLVDHAAYICLDTGRIYWKSGEAGLEEDDLPADIEESDRHLRSPTGASSTSAARWRWPSRRRSYPATRRA